MVVIIVVHLLTGIVSMTHLRTGIMTPAGVSTPDRLRQQTALLSIWDHRLRQIVPPNIWGRPLTVASTAGSLKTRLS